ncbi:MAG: sugar ABC transporter ATP-binding protein [Spirochaetales bacterium]|nr:sugar ABC transporter ATP-binding protein [Spirochaetales bacterium]
MESTPILQVKSLSKSFPGVKALAGVDLSVWTGEVHALMGENGAGKSTLIKLITGVYRRDQGEIIYNGEKVNFSSPREAQEKGISTVYQEVNLIPTLSVAENIFIGRFPPEGVKINWKSIKKSAEDSLKKLDLCLDVTQPLSSFPIAIQQMIAIARAVDFQAKVLILDEPTSSLDAKEVNLLFSIIRKLRDDGLGIIFVTHFLEQVYEISDKITVLRNGLLVGEFETQSLPRLELVAKMMGKDLEEFENTEKKLDSAVQVNGNRKNGKSFIQIRGFGKKGMIYPFDLEINKGEVLGLAGLLGSGRSEMAKLLFGIERADKGKIYIDKKAVSGSSPKFSIKKGMGFCPEDRKTSGIIEDLTVRENIMLAVQTRQGLFRKIAKKKQDEIVAQYIKALNISTPSPEQKIKNLSGGNQQKVIVARWLASQPRLLILDEPTRGIDVGAKAEIQKLILKLSREGMSILFISSELSEILRCSTRIAVLRDKVKVAEMMNQDIDESAIMQAIAEEDNGN